MYPLPPNPPAPQNFGNFEQGITGGMIQGDAEKTRYDKLVSKEEMMRLRELIMQEKFTLKEVNEIMNLANSGETKMTRLDEYERKILGKYLNIWLGNFVKRYGKVLIASGYYKENWDKLTERQKNMRTDIEKSMTEQFKQSIHSYFYAMRTPLSLEGTLIDSLSKNRQEVEYSGIPGVNPGLTNQGWGNK